MSRRLNLSTHAHVRSVPNRFLYTFSLKSLFLPLFSYIRYDTVIETDLPGTFGVKCRVGIEIRTGYRQVSLLHVFEKITEILFKLIGIIVITCDDPGRSHRITVFIQQRQDVGCLRSCFKTSVPS